MGLFTGSSTTAPRRTTQLKRRSLGRKQTQPSAAAWSTEDQAFATEAPPDGSVLSTPQSHSDNPHASSVDRAAKVQGAPPSVWHSAQQCLSQSASGPASHFGWSHERGAEESDLDLADLQSDNAFLYDRVIPPDFALGSHARVASLLERVEAHVAEHYLDSFGITHQDELVRHHNRLIPFFAKAPRFLSVHSLKRKDLDRDYTTVPDTLVTCARKQLCLGRCLLGFDCPVQDLAGFEDGLASFDPDQSFEGYRYVFVRPQTDNAATGGVSAAEPLGSRMAIDKEPQKDTNEATVQKQPLERRCFNCGETDHAVSQCPMPRNRERIRQSRLNFQESKAQQNDDAEHGDINAHARLHEQVASAEQRLRWLTEFVPGKPSPALVEALTWDRQNNMVEYQQHGRSQEHATDRMGWRGWNGDEKEPRPRDGRIESRPELSARTGEQGSSLDLPYLHNMLIWGYPPGWISSQDPIESIKQRIRCDTVWDSVEVLDGFDAAVLEREHKSMPAGKPQAEASETALDGKAGVEERRWVDYQTHLFDSFRLQSFDTVFRTPLRQQYQDDAYGLLHLRKHESHNKV